MRYRSGTWAFALIVGSAGCIPDAGRIQGSNSDAQSPSAETNPLTEMPPGAGNGSGTVSTGTPQGSPFEALSPEQAGLRVKNLLTGCAPTPEEYQALGQNPAALEALVDAWITTPEYQAKMEVFWADAFQQSQAQAEDFHLSLDDLWFTPTDALLLNFRQSFARTVGQLVKEGAPFTEVATTRRYMMTTGMMMYLAYADTSLQGDSPAAGVSGPGANRVLMQNPGFRYTLQRAGGQISLADSANPSSPNYLKFYIPTLGSDRWRTPGSDNQGDANYCKQFDPVVMDAKTSFENAGGLTKQLYAALKGDEYRFFMPPQDQPGAKFCAAEPTPSVLTDADHADWRMVTLTTPANPSAQTRFFDLAGLRQANQMALYSPRVGYFTTPAFFSQWNTNISNQARVTANQTLIAGLGRAFDGSLAVKLNNPPGLNAEHAANPSCMACHMNLDPMRQFFRQNYSLSFSAQLDDQQKSMMGTFGFDGQMGASSSMFDLGKMIATHPRFKVAWAQKLCNWANSTVCDTKDPELLRIADVFASSNYNWQVLAKAMFTSPLTTYLAATATARNQGVTAPIARRAHLCATLDRRLGLDDSCGLRNLQDGLRGSVYTNLAYNVPKDAYSRGAVDPIYVTAPDMFYRNVVENLCSLVADRVVDTAGPVTFSSDSPQSATDQIARTLLGLDEARAVPVSAALRAHFDHARTGGENATSALKSTFVLACISPYLTSIGQ